MEESARLVMKFKVKGRAILTFCIYCKIRDFLYRNFNDEQTIEMFCHECRRFYWILVRDGKIIKYAKSKEGL